MARSSIPAPVRLSTPVITSQRAPTSNSGTPSYTPATSPRSSTSDTRRPSASRRISSRRSVVLPPPGGLIIKVLSNPPAVRPGYTSRAQPLTSRGMRTATLLSCLMVSTCPALSLTCPARRRSARSPSGSSTDGTAPARSLNSSARSVTPSGSESADARISPGSRAAACL